MSGLWIGSKPNMNLFLYNWVEKMITLYEKGTLITPYDKNEPAWICKVVVNCMSLDSPAKASVQNFKQYNCKYGGFPVCTTPVIRKVINYYK